MNREKKTTRVSPGRALHSRVGSNGTTHVNQRGVDVCWLLPGCWTMSISSVSGWSRISHRSDAQAGPGRHSRNAGQPGLSGGGDGGNRQPIPGRGRGRGGGM